MSTMRKRTFMFVVGPLMLLTPLASGTRGEVIEVPKPSEIIGWEPGEDRKMVDAAQVVRYFQALDAASDRVTVFEIGKSVEGRPLQIAAISSENNIRHLDRHKEIARRLAEAKGLTDDEARRLAAEGRAIVWIDHGIHATEPAPSDGALLLAHRLVTGEDDETRMIRENAIVLVAPMLNPDGRERLLKWYRQTVNTPYERSSLPYLDHPYVGHENNRDFFMLVTPEARAVARALWQEWMPQIVMNHHQGAPFPSRIFIPPFQEPLNPDIHPLAIRGINLVGSGIGLRFDREGKPGAISRASYTIWWNGAEEGSSTFHNQLGVLAETHAAPAFWATPGHTRPDAIPASFRSAAIPVGMSANAPSVFYPNPWLGGDWTYRDQVEYSVTASMGTADMAARLRETWLWNIYKMGRDAITRGREGDPYAYVIPIDGQWDRGEAVELVNALRRGGLEVHRATAPFVADGQRYGTGTYVAFSGQAFRPHLLSLMEPQAHPDLRQYPGGPPIPPYDQSAWTLPMMMGVTTQRIDRPFDAETVLEPAEATRPGQVSGDGVVYALTPNENAAFGALFRLWADGATLRRASSSFQDNGRRWPAGTFLVSHAPSRLAEIAAATGVEFMSIRSQDVDTVKLDRPRIGLYQSYVVSTHNPDEGWTRWIFDRYGIPYVTLTDSDIREKDLQAFSVIILPDSERPTDLLRGHQPGTMPPQYVGGLGAEGAANLKRFVKEGGVLIALDRVGDFAVEQLGLPLRNIAASLDSRELMVPGSLLRVDVDASHPLAWGLPSQVSAMYYRRHGHGAGPTVWAPVGSGELPSEFKINVPARFAQKDLLMSGWLVGEQHLRGTPAVVETTLGRGTVVLINFRTQFRDQARGTFKFLFNALLLPSTGTQQRTSARR